jgi:hypothetical protein
VIRAFLNYVFKNANRVEGHEAAIDACERERVGADAASPVAARVLRSSERKDNRLVNDDPVSAARRARKPSVEHVPLKLVAGGYGSLLSSFWERY